MAEEFVVPRAGHDGQAIAQADRPGEGGQRQRRRGVGVRGNPVLLVPEVDLRIQPVPALRVRVPDRRVRTVNQVASPLGIVQIVVDHGPRVLGIKVEDLVIVRLKLLPDRQALDLFHLRRIVTPDLPGRQGLRAQPVGPTLSAGLPTRDDLRHGRRLVAADLLAVEVLDVQPAAAKVSDDLQVGLPGLQVVDHLLQDSRLPKPVVEVDAVHAAEGHAPQRLILAVAVQEFIESLQQGGLEFLLAHAAVTLAAHLEIALGTEAGHQAEPAASVHRRQHAVQVLGVAPRAVPRRNGAPETPRVVGHDHPTQLVDPDVLAVVQHVLDRLRAAEAEVVVRRQHGEGVEVAEPSLIARLRGVDLQLRQAALNGVDPYAAGRGRVAVP